MSATALLNAPAATTSSRRCAAPAPQPFASRPALAPRRGSSGASSSSSRVQATHRVQLELRDGTSRYLEVPEGENVLNVALEEAGLENELDYDCRMGVCLRCAAKVESGEVDQDAGMLSDDVVEKGYALLCVSLPQSDCHVRVIPEEELMDEAMATSAAQAAKA